MTSLVTSALDRVRNYAGAFAWGPLVQTSRQLVLSLLSRIEHGSLTVVEKDGITTVYGEVGAETLQPAAHLRVIRDSFWLRLALFADMVRSVAPLSQRRN